MFIINKKKDEFKEVLSDINLIYHIYEQKKIILKLFRSFSVVFELFFIDHIIIKKTKLILRVHRIPQKSQNLHKYVDFTEQKVKESKICVPFFPISFMFQSLIQYCPCLHEGTAYRSFLLTTYWSQQ